VHDDASVDPGEACKAKVTGVHGRHDNRAARRRRNANVRERSRMTSINAAFSRLRALLPPLTRSQPAARRKSRHCGPSKVETLRLAVAYIDCLTRLVGATGHRPSEPLTPPDRLDSDALNGVVIVSTRLQQTGDSRQSFFLSPVLLETKMA